MLFDIALFVAGLFCIISGRVPFLLMGGNPIYESYPETARKIGLLLVAPFALTLCNICLLFAMASVPDEESLLQVFNPFAAIACLQPIVRYGGTLLALAYYYSDRSYRATGSDGLLVGTDIPADRRFAAGDIALKNGRAIFLSILSMFLVPLSLILLPLAVWQLVRAERLVRQNDLPQHRSWVMVAGVFVGLAVLWMMLGVVIFLLIMISSPSMLEGAITISPGQTATLAPTPTATPELPALTGRIALVITEDESSRIALADIQVDPGSRTAAMQNLRFITQPLESTHSLAWSLILEAGNCLILQCLPV